MKLLKEKEGKKERGKDKVGSSTITLPVLPSLSCWWTGGSTELWRTSLEQNLPCFSAPHFSHSLRNSDGLTTPN